MKRTVMFCFLASAMILGYPAEGHCQKSRIIEESGTSSGKSEIKESSSESESGKSGLRLGLFSRSEESSSSSSSNSESSSSSSSYSSPSTSQESYSTPEPVQESYSAPKPTYESSSSTSESPSNPKHTYSTGASESPSSSELNSAPRPTNAPGMSGYNPAPKGIFTTPGRTGSTVEPEALLPGVRPTQLPPPDEQHGSRNVTDPHSTIVGSLQQDSLPVVSPPVGVNLPMGPRPDFQTLENPRPTALPPKDFSQFSSPSPKPKPAPISNSGGTVMSASDPYDQNTTSPNNPTISVADAPMMAPELACILLASDSLVAFFRDPQWCNSRWERQYDEALLNYRLCYGQLDKTLVESWMWPCYLTFQDERNFWSEECATGNAQLMMIRNFLREKALAVPNLLVDLDATKPADWEYVDTAFAAPSGGQNYYAAMLQFDPAGTQDRLLDYLRDYSVIKSWPSYVTLRNFYAKYSRSDIWTLLRAKAFQDLGLAKDKGDAEAELAFALAENAGWICAAMELMETRDPDLKRLHQESLGFLRHFPNRWEASPLNKVLR